MSKTENAFEKKCRMGQGEVCLWRKWAFHHSFKVRFHSWNLLTLSQSNRLCYAFGEDIKEIRCGPCPYGNFCQAGRKKILAHEITPEHLENNINQEKKMHSMPNEDWQLVTICNIFWMFPYAHLFHRVGAFFPFQSKECSPKHSVLERKKMKKRDKKGKLLWNERDLI